jgi:ribosomal protein S18 acetylase RimI-like enzyme
MKKFIIIISFCLISTLRTMEQLPNEVLIDFAEQKHIPALKALSDEVVNEFFKPAMIAGYSDNPSVQNPEVLNQFFDGIDAMWDELLEKATSSIENNGNRVLTASTKEEPDKILGCCAFTKEDTTLYIQYLIVSKQARGKGIGKALANNALSMYKDITSCKFDTLAYGNDEIQALYERHGCTSTKELSTAVACIPNTHIMYQLDIKK